MNISQLTILGTHDSTTYGIKFPLSFFAKCQEITLEEQLKLGVRYFDIRLNYDKIGLMCYHGIACCNITWNSVRKIFIDFLKDNPNEFILLRVMRGDDQTGKRAVTNEEWENRFYYESGDDIQIVTEDVDESIVRGKISIINLNYTKMAPIIDVPLYYLNCKNEDVTKLINECNILTKIIGTDAIKMICTHSDGSIKWFNNIKLLNKIPYPKGFFNMFNKRSTELNIVKGNLYIFDFVNRIDKNLINRIIKLNDVN